MIRAEALGDAPPQAERGDWMFGSVDPTEFTEPDEHGWMAIVPSSLPRIWIPRALCFWRMVVSIGGTISLEQLAPPAHSLARWPRSEEHTSELQSLMRISYAVFCLKTTSSCTQKTPASTTYHTTTHKHTSLIK